MGLRQPSEQRFFTRFLDVDLDFDGRLTTEEDGRELAGRVVDVCRDGLGVLLPQSITVGTSICLDFKDKRIAFQVVYCLPDLVHRGSFRCGLHRRGPGENLVSLFRTHHALLER